MNNLEDIYNNVLENIHKFYGHEFYNRVNGKLQIPISNVFFESASYKNVNWENLKNDIIKQLILSDNADNFGLYLGSIRNQGITIKDDNGNIQETIPVYVLFTFKNNPINTFIIKNSSNTHIDTTKVNFIINIITHVFQQNVSSVNVNIDAIIKNMRAPEYFYRPFTYKEFSVDIFNHIYQPRFQLIDDPTKIKEITNKYLMDLSSMGSIFINDPVNKRLLGLPKINKDNIRKDYPDIYRIYQEQGINYRKVIASGSHNPFSK